MRPLIDAFDTLVADYPLKACDRPGRMTTNTSDTAGHVIRTEHVPFEFTNLMPPTVTAIPSGCVPTTSQ